jgi:anti-sigma B factor antagonist
MMHVDIEELNNFCVIDIKGGVTLAYASELKEVLLDSIANHPDIEVRLHDINDIDSAAIQTLWLAKREARQANKNLRYVDHSPAVIELLQIYNLIEEFADPLPDNSNSEEG